MTLGFTLYVLSDSGWLTSTITAFTLCWVLYACFSIAIHMFALHLLRKELFGSGKRFGYYYYLDILLYSILSAWTIVTLIQSTPKDFDAYCDQIKAGSEGREDMLNEVCDQRRVKFILNYVDAAIIGVYMIWKWFMLAYYPFAVRRWVHQAEIKRQQRLMELKLQDELEAYHQHTYTSAVDDDQV